MSKTGSTANSVGNRIYSDLSLSRFPKAFDERGGSKNNPNLNRWTNLVDYNMAEHINALQDASMAIQRSLGEMPQMPAKPVSPDGKPITNPTELENISKVSTVSARLGALETKDWFNVFDKRYGGKTWEFTEGAALNPTIQQHRHTGSSSGIKGMPEQINLKDEVKGTLPKGNIDLSKTSKGVTGADIFVETNSALKISEALSDSISEKTGGTIAKDATLTINGKTNTRWTREYDVTDAVSSGNSIVADNKTLLRQAVQSGDTAQSDLLNVKIEGMYHGRYVINVRAAISHRIDSEVLLIESLDGAGRGIGLTRINGTDFASTNTYKNFYLIFEHSDVSQIRIRKTNTSTPARIKLDYTIVEPVHPAVFDR